MSLSEQVVEVSIDRSTKADVIDYYQKEYPGSRTDSKGRRIEAWRTHATAAYAQVTGLSRASAAREFQGARAKSSGSKNAEVWERIGNDLPKRAPDGGYRFEGKLCLIFSKEEVERHVDVTLEGDPTLAMAFASNDEGILAAVINMYMNDDAGDGDHPALPCDEGEGLEVTAVGE